MKNRFRFTILILAFCLWMSQGAMAALAETEGSAEGGANVTQSHEMSMDDTLSSLKIAQAALSPEFSPNQLTYAATVPYEVERVALTAQTNSPEARKVIRGTSDLKVGENTITVTVTAENGSVREYRITLIRQEMPETTPSEGGETQETPAIDESDSQDETAESVTEENTTEESLDTTPEETVPVESTQDETAMPPQDTKPSGGMVIETTEETPWDLESLLLSPMFMIGLVGAIVLLVLIIIVVAVIVLREKLSRGKDEDDNEDDDIADSHDDDSDDNKERKDKSDTTALAEVQTVSQQAAVVDTVAEKKKEIVVLDWDDDFEDEVRKRSASQPMSAEDDLDDDFEMLLEDDDDFDFLEF